ncbi:hypothetical protein GCM10008915_36710 [Bifidobacterium pullorum subsp. gallinarum]
MCKKGECLCATVGAMQTSLTDVTEQNLRLSEENATLREALSVIMHVSKWDGIAPELDRCYSVARDALEEVYANATQENNGR